MINRLPIYERTIMGAVSLEYTISGAALKCQSRKDCRTVMQMNMHCFMDMYLYNQSSREAQPSGKQFSKMC